MVHKDLIYEILSVVEEIPEGCVATYGQIARLIGRDKNSRLVGKVLSMAEYYGDYPCHRVVNHAGRLVPGWPLVTFFLFCPRRVTALTVLSTDIALYIFNFRIGNPPGIPPFPSG